MKCYTRLSVVIVLSLGMFAGCGKSSPSSGATAGSAGVAAPESVPVITETDPNSSPVAQTTYDWLGAVLKGETERAKALLTPQAIQRISTSGVNFAPPGLQSATFKIGEVRSPSDDQAIVQCVLTDTSEVQPHSEEMCCLLRKVGNVWRVSGIAYGTGPDKPWMLSDFESGQSMAIPQQTMADSQPNNVAPPVSPPAPLGPPVASPATVNVPNYGAPGVGMPVVGQSVNGQQQSYPPYTAQEQQPNERR